MGSHGEDPFACLHPAPWEEALKSCWDACMLWYCTLQHCCWVCCRQLAVPSKAWHTRERFPQVWKNKGALKSLWAAYIQKLSEKKRKGKKEEEKKGINMNSMPPLLNSPTSAMDFSLSQIAAYWTLSSKSAGYWISVSRLAFPMSPLPA